MSRFYKRYLEGKKKEEDDGIPRPIDPTAMVQQVTRSSATTKSGSGSFSKRSGSSKFLAAAATRAAPPAPTGPTRRQQIFNDSQSYSPDDSIDLAVFPKPLSSKLFLRRALSVHYLFESLGPDDMDRIVDCMRPTFATPGEVIIRQGDIGDLFFCLETGSCEATVNGQMVFTYDTGGCFGELALIYNSPRAASVTALTACKLWAIDLKTFRYILATTSSSKMVTRCNFLKKCAFLEPLSNEQISKLAYALDTCDFENNHYIIRQGEMGDTFYIIEEGTVRCTQLKANGREVDLISLRTGEYFGEMALMLNEPRHANVVAVGKVKCLSMDREKFDILLGSVKDVLAKRMRIRILQSVPLLSRLPEQKLARLAAVMRVQSFNDGEYIIRQGEDGSRFYIINEGEVKCTRNINISSNQQQSAKGQIANQSVEEEELVRLGVQEFFGERALITSEARKANVIACGHVECLVLERSSFESLLTEVQEEITETMSRREALSPSGSSVSSPYRLGLGSPAFSLQSMGSKSSAASTMIASLGGESPRVQDGANTPSSILSRISSSSSSRSRRNSSTNNYNEGSAAEDLSNGVAAMSLRSDVDLDDLRSIRTVGTGSFGRVKLVQNTKTGQVFALKCMNKSEILAAHQEKNIISEKNLLVECAACDFVLKLISTFNQTNQIFMLMEFVQGGELWSYIYEKTDALPRSTQGGFENSAVKFYIVNIIIAFHFIHSREIAYRDLKPENLLMDENGYLKLIDFGFAKKFPYTKGGDTQVTYDKTYTLCGTPEYLAPEIVMSKGYDKSVDHWALGCLLYELVTSRTPFQADYTTKIFQNICSSEKTLTFPPKADQNFVALCKKLLNSSPAFRLGNLVGGDEDILAEPYFSGVDIAAIASHQARAPFTPPIQNALDSSNFDEYDETSDIPEYYGSQDIFAAF